MDVVCLFGLPHSKLYKVYSSMAHCKCIWTDFPLFIFLTKCLERPVLAAEQVQALAYHSLLHLPCVLALDL